MKKKYLSIFSIFMITIVSACGPAPEPTLSADDIANTAIADAWTMLTLTQAAIPTATATFIPTETFTPQPTFTPIPINTLPPVVAVTVTSATNPCYDPPPSKPKGKLVQIKLVNNSKGLVDLSMGMENPNDKGECASYYFPLGRYDQPVVTILAGCYWAYAYIKDPDSDAKALAPLCFSDATKIVPISIGNEVIGLQ